MLITIEISNQTILFSGTGHNPIQVVALAEGWPFGSPVHTRQGGLRSVNQEREKETKSIKRKREKINKEILLARTYTCDALQARSLEQAQILPFEFQNLLFRGHSIMEPLIFRDTLRAGHLYAA